MDLQDQLKAILHDGVVRFPFVNTLGIHSTATYRTVVDRDGFFEGDGSGPGRFFDEQNIDPGLFEPKQFYDIIVHTDVSFHQ